MAEMFYDDDADLSLIQGKQRRRARLRQPGPRPRAVAARLRRRRPRRPARGLEEPRQGRGRGPARPHAGRGRRGGRRDHDPRAGPRRSGKLYAESIEPNLTPGDALFFGHGFNIRFGYITPPERRRRRHGRAEGPGPPGPPRVRRRPRRAGPRRRRAGRLRQGLGPRAVLRQGASAAPAPACIKTTFTEETETDLFGEQAVLCGGASQLVMYGFEMLTEAGYQPEVAYFECLHELKLIVDLMYEGGIAKQRWSVSDTAEYGDYVSGPRVIDARVKENMKAVLDGHPERRVRPAVHRRPGRRRPGVQGAAREGRAAPDRGDRPRAARADGLGQEPRHRLRRGLGSSLTLLARGRSCAGRPLLACLIHQGRMPGKCRCSLGRLALWSSD